MKGSSGEFVAVMENGYFTLYTMDRFVIPFMLPNLQVLRRYWLSILRQALVVEQPDA